MPRQSQDRSPPDRRRSRRAAGQVCPGVLAHRSATKQVTVALQPVTTSHVVGPAVRSITSVGTRPPSVSPMRSLRLPGSPPVCGCGRSCARCAGPARLPPARCRERRACRAQPRSRPTRRRHRTRPARLSARHDGTPRVAAPATAVKPLAPLGVGPSALDSRYGAAVGARRPEGRPRWHGTHDAGSRDASGLEDRPVEETAPPAWRSIQAMRFGSSA